MLILTSGWARPGNKCSDPRVPRIACIGELIVPSSARPKRRGPDGPQRGMGLALSLRCERWCFRALQQKRADLDEPLMRGDRLGEGDHRHMAMGLDFEQKSKCAHDEAVHY